jgi:hypothetical protein
MSMPPPKTTVPCPRPATAVIAARETMQVHQDDDDPHDGDGPTCVAEIERSTPPT